MKKKYLLTPGPTPLPPEVMSALAKPIIHHRTAEYSALFVEVNNGLKSLFQTAEDVFTFASSGTGAMEASVVNLLSPKDKVIMVEAGKFGERWLELGNTYGLDVIPVHVQWGKAVESSLIEKLLKENPDAKAVFVTLCETSTGVKTDIKTIAAITAKTNAVLVVDAISGLGAMELKTDEWGVDVVVSGSQKGMMLPPGLAFISLSKKAQKMLETSTLPKYYLNLKAYKKALDKSDTPYTPAISLTVALTEALKLINDEGLENVLKRHAVMAEATRQAVKALGLEVFASSPADAVTSVKLPEGMDGSKLYKTMKDELGVQAAGGQGDLKGKILRIAHLGYMDASDVILGISALEVALGKIGYPVKMGEGVKAAQKVLYQINS
ncbi:MAG: alanine--glyoxylate aminotransferase family protein [Candidatus Omnitrophica bacterium]|nr:alanine--glyoxylate aminotransferase family protein [Candidatus Omnitrophota bacterium]MBU1047826.1 alanine--glyoxylate aminotransferase family protein [Candidatus Omnitrophota bacterium]MBU1631103.1 alanine--glyoxylate aminotransferase family protein [Candidatus Omnitrophota bacterium]MBU1889213.1 alanine--glyoxylate aminotransferase family protein [Candidatus Omnitrophota bacterium]